MKDHNNKPIEVPPFYVGQEVIAVCNHMNVLKAGQEYKIRSLTMMTCGCWLVDVGVSDDTNNPLVKCTLHGDINAKAKNQWVLYAFRFAPKEQRAEFISLKQVAEQTLETTGAN